MANVTMARQDDLAPVRGCRRYVHCTPQSEYGVLEYVACAVTQPPPKPCSPT